MSDDPEQLRGFTSWKMDILNAMSVDTGVTDLDFRVAFRIMQHVNSVSRIAWPSVARLSAQLGKSEDRIRAATRRLQQTAWIAKGRKSQKAPNEYSFLNDRVVDILDIMQARVEIIETTPVDHAEMHGQSRDDRADLRLDHAEMHGPDHAEMHDKHLNQNYLQGTPSSGRSEEGAAKDRMPFKVPKSEDEAVDLVEALLEGLPRSVVASLFDVIRDHLMAGELTPAKLHNLIGRAAA